MSLKINPEIARSFESTLKEECGIHVYLAKNILNLGVNFSHPIDFYINFFFQTLSHKDCRYPSINDSSVEDSTCTLPNCYQISNESALKVLEYVNNLLLLLTGQSNEPLCSNLFLIFKLYVENCDQDKLISCGFIQKINEFSAQKTKTGNDVLVLFNELSNSQAFINKEVVDRIQKCSIEIFQTFPDIFLSTNTNNENIYPESTLLDICEMINLAPDDDWMNYMNESIDLRQITLEKLINRDCLGKLDVQLIAEAIQENSLIFSSIQELNNFNCKINPQNKYSFFIHYNEMDTHSSLFGVDHQSCAVFYYSPMGKAPDELLSGREIVEKMASLVGDNANFILLKPKDVIESKSSFFTLNAILQIKNGVSIEEFESNSYILSDIYSDLTQLMLL
ncbi:MAG: hypothetical protein WDZ28_00800 [Simkaniaceae bacterium]